MTSPTLKHSHPFTLEQAALLPFDTLTQEIARLQNSIHHLRSSQVALRQHLEESAERDRDLEEALGENDLAIEAQEERITLLQRAIERKGGSAGGGHYDIGVVSMNGRAVARGADTDVVDGGTQAGGGRGMTNGSGHDADVGQEEEEGMYL